VSLVHVCGISGSSYPILCFISRLTIFNRAGTLQPVPPNAGYKHFARNSNTCTCSSVAYSTLSACALCQGGVVDSYVIIQYPLDDLNVHSDFSWLDYIEDCSADDVSVGMYETIRMLFLAKYSLLFQFPTWNPSRHGRAFMGIFGRYSELNIYQPILTGLYDIDNVVANQYV
jgi:hypothetical protein